MYSWPSSKHTLTWFRIPNALFFPSLYLLNARELLASTTAMHTILYAIKGRASDVPPPPRLVAKPVHVDWADLLCVVVQ